MTIRSYSSASASSSYARKRPALPPVDVLRPMTASVDYAGTVTSPRSASVPPSTSYVRQQTPSQHHRPQSARRLSSTSSLSDLSSPGALSSRSPMSGSLSSRYSTSMASLPVSRGSRSTVRLMVDADDEARRGSSYSTRTGSHPPRQSYQAGKTRRYNFLADIEEEDAASRDHVRDLRMRASKARQCLDQHRQVLDRLRALQMNGPPTPPVVSVSLLASPLPSVKPTSTPSVRRENTRGYLPMSTPPMSVIRSELTVSPSRRALRDLLSRGRTTTTMQRQSHV